MAVFGCFSVPYLAIASKLAPDPKSSTKLMAWRLGFTSIGVLIASGFSPWFLSKNGSLESSTALSAYAKLGVVLAILCGITLLIAFLAIRTAPAFRDQSMASESRGTSLASMWQALTSRRFAPLVTANLFQLTGAGMSYAAFLYFLTYNMQLANPFAYIPKLIFLSSLGIILAQPMWVALAARFGKKSIYILSSFFYAGVLCFWAITDGISESFALFLAVLLGISNSGWAMLSFSMVTDISAEGDGSVYSAGWISVDKVGFALGGTLLIGLVLNAFGFNSEIAVMGGTQSAAALTGTMLGFGVLPAMLVSVGTLIFWLWGKEN